VLRRGGVVLVCSLVIGANIDTTQCVSGDVCESVLCAVGELCPGQKFCVNVTATA
jgi:hypothetical protein